MSTITINGFVKLSRSLLDRLEMGELGWLSLAVLYVITLQANYLTGVWVGSSVKLAASVPKDCPDQRTLNRALQLLEKNRFIKRFITPGKRGNYPVLVNHYLIADGALKGKELNADKSTDWREPIYEVCHDDAMK
jgi:hypothetical protein